MNENVVVGSFIVIRIQDSFILFFLMIEFRLIQKVLVVVHFLLPWLISSCRPFVENSLPY